MLRVAIVFALLGACVQSNATQCEFGLCPSDRACDEAHHVCVRPDQLTSCMPGQTQCMVGDRPGTCTDGVCLEDQCGDGIVSGTEQCDGDAFVNNANDCLNVGFYDSGPIACKSDCTIDVSECSRTCGDLTKDPEEVCEYSVANASTTCKALGYYEDAEAPCTPFCSYDTTKCKTRCGDGVLQTSELCEPTLGLPSYLSCLDYGFDSGIATCGGTCNADLAACHHFGVSNAGARSMLASDVWQAAPSIAFVVGQQFSPDLGVIVAWNGTQLTPVAPAAGLPFFGVSGTSPTNVFAVGQLGRIAHFDGTSVTDMVAPANGGLNDVFALDATHVYAVGASGVIEKYDGTTWTAITSGNNDLKGVWASSPSDVWAVGASGAIRHYNGSVWAASPSGVTQELRAVWGSGPADVFAVGSFGTILHFNGTSWSTTQLPASLSFTRVSGAGPDDVIAVCDKAMLHYDGTRWTQLEPTLASASGVSMLDHAHGVVIAIDGRILRWDGVAVTGRSPLDPAGGSDLWGTSSLNLFAATTTSVWRYNGVSWNPIDSTGANAIWGTSATDVFVAGSASIRHYNGSTWTPMTLPPQAAGALIADVWGLSSQDVYAVDEFGDVLHYDGQWTVIYDDPADNPLTSVWASSSSDIWAVGSDVLLHWDGTTWTSVSEPRTYYAVWGTSDTNVYAVGAAGVARHYDGTAWTPLALPNQTRDLKTIYGTSANDIFIGGAGTLQHFDGTQWAPVTTGVDSAASDAVAAVWASSHDIAVLGADGAAHFIVRACPTCL